MKNWKFFVFLNFLSLLLVSDWFLPTITETEAITISTMTSTNYKACRPSNSFIVHGECFRCLEFRDNGIPEQGKLCPLEKTTPKQNITTDMEMKYSQNSPTENSNCIKSLPCAKSPTAIRTFRANKGKMFLTARKLQVVTIERQPFTKTTKSTYTGIIFEFLNALSRKYNFTMNIFLPDDGNWGAKINGSWNGMVGLIRRNEADLGAASFSITLDRAQAVDFTVAFHQEPSAILIPPPNEGEKLSVLIRPLSKEVWWAVFTTVGILAPTMFLFHIISLKISGYGQEIKIDIFHFMGRLFNFLVASLVQESITSPGNNTTRFLVALWWLITLTIANVYVAFLMSYLATPKLHNLVDNLDGLTHQKIVKWTFRRNAALQDLFMSDNSLGVYKSIGDGVHEKDLVMSDYEGVDQVLTGKFAFLKERSFLDVAIGQDFVKTNQCRLTMAKETFFSVGIALAVQKQSPILDLLNSEILRCVSTGIMEKWKTLHWPKDLWCADAASFLISTRPRTRKLSLKDSQGAYFLWTCGIIFGVSCFAVEMVFGFIKNFGKRKKDAKLIHPYKNSFNSYSLVV